MNSVYQCVHTHTHTHTDTHTHTHTHTRKHSHRRRDSISVKKFVWCRTLTWLSWCPFSVFTQVTRNQKGHSISRKGFKTRIIDFGQEKSLNSGLFFLFFFFFFLIVDMVRNMCHCFLQEHVADKGSWATTHKLYVCFVAFYITYLCAEG